MRDRKGNWTDLFASHALAVDAKKIWLGFLASVCTVALFILFGYVQGYVAGSGNAHPGDNVLKLWLTGQCAVALAAVLPLFNPFAAGWMHFASSFVFYMLLLGIWTYFAAPVTRLGALQYARYDIPTLNDALKMVRKKRKAFFFAPVPPLLAVFVFGLCNQLAGLIGSIPYVGPWILTVLLPLGVLPGTIILTFIMVLGILSFGLMLPSISIGGKDAFEGWSSAYSYLLWGFNRFVCYSLLAAIIGLLSVAAAAGLAELFIHLMHRTVSIGLIGGELFGPAAGFGILRGAPEPLADGAIGLRVASWTAVVIAIIIRSLVAAYAFSFFFTSNTIICFLMRKHVDRIDVDEVYCEEMDEEEEEAADDDSGEETLPESDVDTDTGAREAEKAGDEGQEPETAKEPEAVDAEPDEETAESGDEQQADDSSGNDEREEEEK